VNLLENAALAIPDGAAGRNEIAVIGRAEGDRVVIEVRDTGAGIAPDALPRIFDPFFTTRPVGHGTGLGLAVCHGIVTALGGRIEVESTPGQGTVFRISLPAAAPADETPPEPARAAEPRRAPPRAVAGPGRVLVIDDEPLFGRSVARLLAGSASVESAADLGEALARIRAGARWDVILCDLAAAGGDAASVEVPVAAEAPELLPAIVYLTGGPAGPDAARLPRRGCALEKPIDPAALRALIAERVRGRASNAPERAAG
jgi:CheY-like chemotaxis protein